MLSRFRRRRLSVAALILGVALACALGCSRKAAPAGPHYEPAPAVTEKPLVVAAFPAHHPLSLNRSVAPLMDRLNGNLPAGRFVFEASLNYEAFEAKIRAGGPAVLIANPLETLMAIDAGYTVVGTLCGPGEFRGVLLVSRDSAVASVANLKGRVVLFPAPTAVAATILPQTHLFANGLKPGTDYESRYVGTQDSAMEGVLCGQAEACGVWSRSWMKYQATHPQEAARLRPLFTTESLPGNALLVRRDLPVALRERIAKAALGMAAGPHAADADDFDILNLRQIRPATDADYAPVRAYLNRFETEVRKIEQP